MEQAQELAFGCLHMKPEDFWDMEPRELMYAFRGYTKDKEEQMQGEWERTRWLATTLVNLQVKKPIKAKDLLPFPWDKKKEKPPEMTPEQVKEFQDRMRQKFNLK